MLKVICSTLRITYYVPSFHYHCFSYSPNITALYSLMSDRSVGYGCMGVSMGCMCVFTCQSASTTQGLTNTITRLSPGLTCGQTTHYSEIYKLTPASSLPYRYHYLTYIMQCPGNLNEHDCFVLVLDTNPLFIHT